MQCGNYIGNWWSFLLMATIEGEKCPAFHTQLLDHYEYIIRVHLSALHVAITVSVKRTYVLKIATVERLQKNANCDAV